MATTVPATPVPSAPALCALRSVNHDFLLPSGQRLRVLEDLQLEIRPHEIVALLGPSGCGKSTILRLLSGLIRPTSGEVLRHGKPLVGVHGGVAMVFQSFALFPWMTVKQNVAAVLRAAGHTPERIAARTDEVLHLVGLSGFEQCYPRELSGGMKQRAGIARALSVDPEILFMDEPFSHVDALTAESLRAEVVDIGVRQGRNPVSIVIVSHDIPEVVFMADRIIVLGAKPGRVRKVIDNKLARPRDYRSDSFQRMVDNLHDIITGHELPEVVPIGGGAIETLPDASTSEILGLLEYLDSRGGRQDLFRIAAETGREFGHVISIVKAAEMLDFVMTPRQYVALDTVGKRFLAAQTAERKQIWREQLLQLHIFARVNEMLNASPDGSIDVELILSDFAIRMPYENHERVFRILLGWARFGDLFDYDENKEMLTRS